jgi:hypothetical protein
MATIAHGLTRPSFARPAGLRGGAGAIAVVLLAPDPARLALRLGARPRARQEALAPGGHPRSEPAARRSTSPCPGPRPSSNPRDAKPRPRRAPGARLGLWAAAAAPRRLGGLRRGARGAGVTCAGAAPVQLPGRRAASCAVCWGRAAVQSHLGASFHVCSCVGLPRAGRAGSANRRRRARRRGCSVAASGEEFLPICVPSPRARAPSCYPVRDV